ncbi:MAG TPA: septation protein A [Gammaproteobacteria bacterium]|nr:septation protein A [Gammaproteobacteria bacterium]HBX27421.1 septation protein A [Gammaproteobacteria bacterium]
MKLLIDFLPILIFFGAYKATGNLITATTILIPVTVIQVTAVYLITKKLEKMALITLSLVIILGGLTILLNDGWFIKWKPTVVNWLFAATFFCSHFVGQKPIIERLLSQAIALDSRRWLKLSYAWILFFTVSGTLNLFVAYQFSEDAWVNFKLFGQLGLTVIFLILQGAWIAKHGSEASIESQEETDA